MCHRKPAILADCANEMVIAHEEAFVQALANIGSGDAIRMASNMSRSPAACVQDMLHHARRTVCRRRAGLAVPDGTVSDFGAPVGGGKLSDASGEWGGCAAADLTGGEAGRDHDATA